MELGIGLSRDGSTVASYSSYVRSSHAEVIADAVSFVLQSQKLLAGDIARIGIAVGPGSFTGLRVGIAFAKGFCIGRTIRILPISSLESLARAWNVPQFPRLVVAFDLRKTDVVWNRFQFRGDRLVTEGPDRHEPAEDFLRYILPDDTIVTDDLGGSRSPALAVPVSMPDRWHRADSAPLQRGLACALSAAKESEDSPRWTDARSLEPRYFAPTYAEQAAGGVK
jgi:tRNA threonylcarbamoyl adenosine modification protein YeaZ